MEMRDMLEQQLHGGKLLQCSPNEGLGRSYLGRVGIHGGKGEGGSPGNRSRYAVCWVSAGQKYEICRCVFVGICIFYWYVGHATWRHACK